MKSLVLALAFAAVSVIAGCAGNPYDDDPLLKPPQLIDAEKKKPAE
ncbi:MAG: hypothetical protein ACPGSC_01830 [Granulosicoccaceae bacterium]